jgi:hypothetical protein
LRCANFFSTGAAREVGGLIGSQTNIPHKKHSILTWICECSNPFDANISSARLSFTSPPKTLQNRRDPALGSYPDLPRSLQISLHRHPDRPPPPGPEYPEIPNLTTKSNKNPKQSRESQLSKPSISNKPPKRRQTKEMGMRLMNVWILFRRST